MKKALIALLAMFVLVPTTALAAQFVGPDKNDQGRVVIGSSETRKNLYAAGADLTVNGIIEGDIFGAAAFVTVDGDIEDDATIAGNTVSLNSPIGGDLRTAGSRVSINNTVGGDGLIAGSSVVLGAKSSFGGDVYIGGAGVTVDGPVMGDLKIVGDSVRINSKIDGSVWVKSNKKIVFGSNADVAGKLTIVSNELPLIESGANVSEPEMKPWVVKKSNKDTERGFLGFLTFMFLVKLIAGFITAWILLSLFRSRFTSLVAATSQNFWKHALFGFIGVVVAPIIAIILFVTLIGYMAGILVLCAYVSIWVISYLTGLALTGAWLMKKIKKQDQLMVNWQSILVGVLVFAILAVIPVIGWIVCMIIVLASAGSLFSRINSSIESNS